MCNRNHSSIFYLYYTFSSLFSFLSNQVFYWVLFKGFVILFCLVKKKSYFLTQRLIGFIYSEFICNVKTTAQIIPCDGKFIPLFYFLGVRIL